MKRFALGTAIATALLGLSWTAQASTITATFDSLTPGHGVTVDLGGNAFGTTAGRFNYTRTGGTHPETPKPNAGGVFWAFCVELGEGIGFGSSTTWEVTDLANGATVIGGIGAARASQLRELLGAVYPDFSVPLAGNDEYAALQIAIWEITRETAATFDVNAGTLLFTNTPAAVLNLANGYLANVDGNGPQAQGVRALVRRGTQDMLVQFPVPEPATFGLGALGLGLMFGLRARRSQSLV